MNDHRTCPVCTRPARLVRTPHGSGSDSGDKILVLEEHQRLDLKKGKEVPCKGKDIVMKITH